jgi:FtsP/CotA-like multicopper oxidase with cupredoxin domain
MDTPIVNGTAYPYLPVERKAYRFRILSAGNDRSFNLHLYYGATAAGVYNTCTEVKMVPAIPTTICTSLNPNLPAGCFPASWPIDGRDGGVPDPATVGPSMILIGTESGFLPAPVVLPNQPITFDAVGNVARKTLLLMPAERADVIIDFTTAPLGSTIILYSDAPATLPGGDPRYDYYTGIRPQHSDHHAVPGDQCRKQHSPRQCAESGQSISASGSGFPGQCLRRLPARAHRTGPDGQYAKLIDTSMTIGGVTIPFMGKSINEGFDSTYGRINAMLGTEDPNGLAPPVPLEYVAAATELLKDGQTQLWKITHNGIDSHPIHFHLTDVQIVSRIAWSGEILSPDLSEVGWKETVRMNPMEDIIVAMRPTAPALPFTIPNSIRPPDATLPVSVANPLTNFGWEYAWHCHILGHEEFDLMRPMIINVDQLLYASFTEAGIQQWDMGYEVR